MQESVTTSGSIAKNETILSFETEKDICFTFILPNFNYSLEMWNQRCKGCRNKLGKVNERALQFVFSDYNSAYVILLQKLRLPSLEN